VDYLGFPFALFNATFAMFNATFKGSPTKLKQMALGSGWNARYAAAVQKRHPHPVWEMGFGRIIVEAEYKH
jgi:hypothetical protein